MTLRKVLQRAATRVRRIVRTGKANVDQAEFFTSAAERLTGRSRSTFASRSFVLMESARAIVRLHEILPTEDPPNLSIPMLRLIEKLSAKPYEAQFYRLMSLQRSWPAVRVAPRLYAAVKASPADGDPRCYIILIEHIDRHGLPDSSAATARCLADSLSEISTLSLKGYERNPHNALTPDYFLRFLAVAEASGRMAHKPTRRAVETMGDRWNQLSTFARKLPSVPCHNDVQRKNICWVPESSGGKRFVFIDWEMFGPNYIGADLHHFIQQRFLQPDFAAFATELERCYFERLCEIHQLDIATVELGAYAYALRRSMLRAITTRTVPALNLSLHLHDKLRRLVD